MSDIKRIAAAERAARAVWLKRKKKEARELFDMNKDNFHLRFGYLEKKLDVLYQIISGKDLHYSDGVVSGSDIPYPYGNYHQEMLRLAKQNR